jgi:flagellar hook-basal body complex protein FliE
MINFDPNVKSILPNPQGPTPMTEGPAAAQKNFSDAVDAIGKYVSKVDDLQQSSENSVEDLLTGKNNDVTAVVSSVAKADVSFKVLVGVRNKLIEAYKQTMNMQL